MVKISRTLHKRVRGRGRGRIRKNPRKRKKRMGFEELQREVAEGYVGKPVPKRWQRTYGKRYSMDEAMEVGAKVAGKKHWRMER